MGVLLATSLKIAQNSHIIIILINEKKEVSDCYNNNYYYSKLNYQNQSSFLNSSILLL